MTPRQSHVQTCQQSTIIFPAYFVRKISTLMPQDQHKNVKSSVFWKKKQVSQQWAAIKWKVRKITYLVAQRGKNQDEFTIKPKVLGNFISLALQSMANPACLEGSVYTYCWCLQCNWNWTLTSGLPWGTAGLPHSVNPSAALLVPFKHFKPI